MRLRYRTITDTKDRLYCEQSVIFMINSEIFHKSLQRYETLYSLNLQLIFFVLVSFCIEILAPVTALSLSPQFVNE